MGIARQSRETIGDVGEFVIVKDASTVMILMYHSISDGAGPTNIPCDTFRQQMDVLQQSDCQVVSLADVVDWHQGRAKLGPRSVVITFDDAFDDFAQNAFEPIRDREWPSTVFVPVAKVGGSDDWETEPGHAKRRLMSWRTIERLSGQGVEFGVHTAHHPDLTTLNSKQLEEEIVGARHELEQRLSQPVRSFAPPFGKTNAEAMQLIRSTYAVSVGTTLAKVSRRWPIHNLPRIEMHYFRQMRRWRDFLGGGARSFFTIRRSLRRIRALASGG